MQANPAVSTGQLEPAYRRGLRLRSWPQVKRRQRPLRGGEVELLQQLGEVPRRPSETGLEPVDRTLARWRWM
jgi:hypothetical protein